MKNKYDLAIKYYSETNNQQQIDLTYQELEKFNEIYTSYQFYYQLDKSSIENNFYSNGTSALINKDLFQNLIRLYKLRFASNVFEQAEFNNELLNSILQEIKPNKKEEEIKIKLFEGKKDDFSTSLLLFVLLLLCFLIIYIQSYFYSLHLNEHFKSTTLINAPPRLY